MRATARESPLLWGLLQRAVQKLLSGKGARDFFVVAHYPLQQGAGLESGLCGFARSTMVASSFLGAGGLEQLVLGLAAGCRCCKMEGRRNLSTIGNEDIGLFSMHVGNIFYRSSYTVHHLCCLHRTNFNPQACLKTPQEH